MRPCTSTAKVGIPPEESTGPWDYYKQIATISTEDAAKPLETSDCPLLKK